MNQDNHEHPETLAMPRQPRIDLAEIRDRIMATDPSRINELVQEAEDIRQDRHPDEQVRKYLAAGVSERERLEYLRERLEHLTFNGDEITSVRPVAPSVPTYGGAHLAVTPHYQAIVAVDIEGSTGWANVAKARLRQVMYELLTKALRASGTALRHREMLVDRGDGVLMLFAPAVPKTVLLNTFVPALTTQLAEHNARWPEFRFRMRVAVHAGEVHYDEQGCFGEAIDLACRLLDAPEVRMKLILTAEPLVLVVSDDVYRSVVRHGYDGIDYADYQLVIQVRLGQTIHEGRLFEPKALDEANRIVRYFAPGVGESAG